MSALTAAEPNEPPEALVRRLVETELRHYGYTDEQVALAMLDDPHTGCCVFDPQVGWECFDEDLRPCHPEWEEADQVAGIIMRALEAMPLPEPLTTDDQRRGDGWLDPIQADQLRAERDRLGNIANEMVQQMEALREELFALKGSRILSVVFGHHHGAPRPFALRRVVDVSGVSGTGIVATGAEFEDGVVALRWCSDWPTTTIHEKGMASIEHIHGHGGSTEVVWLSDELPALAEMEERAEAAETQLAELRALAATCSCGTSPMTYEGPEPDCSVHGAVRALNQAMAERAAWLPVIDAARALVRHLHENIGDPHGEKWLDVAGTIVDAVDALDRGVPDA